LASKDGIRQTVSVRHRLDAAGLARIDPFRREQATQTRLAYVRAAVPNGTEVVNGRTVTAWTMLSEKDVRHAVQALRPAGIGDSRTLGHAVRRGIAVRKRTPDGSAVFGGKGEARRRTKGLVTHEETVRARLLPLYLCGDRVCRGNALAKLVMSGPDGREVAARAALTDPLPAKRERPLKEVTKRPRRDKAKPAAWLRHAAPAGAVLHDAMPPGTRVTALRLALGSGLVVVPLTHHRGKQGRLLAQVAWAGSAGLANVTVLVDDTHVHVTFDPRAVAAHPERKSTAGPFVPGRMLGIDRNPNAIGGAVLDVAVRDGVARADLPGKVIDHLLVLPNLGRYASKEEACEAMAKATDVFIGLARKRRCGTIVVESLRLGSGRTKSRRLNHLLSRWCRTRFLDALRRRAALCGIEVLEVWAAYSTTIGNVCHDLPDACASGAEMARRGLALRATVAGEKPRLLPAYDAGHVLGRLRDLPPAPVRKAAPDRGKEGTRAASRTTHEARMARLLVRAEHVAGWKELHRTMSKSGVRARRPHPVGASGPYAAARQGPSPRGRCLRPQGLARGGTRCLG
jgi:IS605 OrfB family transposase